MLFTSWTFLFGFLPLALVGFWVTSRVGPRLASLWLIVASLTFYGFWAPYLVALIACSIAFNYTVSLIIRATRERQRLQMAALVVGIAADLLALFYYKYLYAILGFLVGLGMPRYVTVDAIILPLGISFFTFTQIGYLVDCQAGITKDNNLLDYILFVTFFPHLIAGPILHNGEMMPQFAEPSTYGFKAANVAAGLTMFIFGMMKKSLLADPLSPLIAPGFTDPRGLHLLGAWGSAVGYSMQLYFDFSGYSDMAIGLALLFNVRFPANFNSPYKARNIIEFWQRWHITLTRYLTQYLYNPIGLAVRRRRMARGVPMSRKAQETPGAFLGLVAFPTILTMLLAGIWHGAGLQFVVFGLLHGIYLTINHAWRLYGPKASKGERPLVQRWMTIGLQVALTYLAVLVAQVFFRANSCQEAMEILQAMIGMRGIFGGVLANDKKMWLLYIVVGCAISLALPNSQQIMLRARPVLGNIALPYPALMTWRPSLGWALCIGIGGALALLALGGTTEFLYFQF